MKRVGFSNMIGPKTRAVMSTSLLVDHIAMVIHVGVPGEVFG